MSIRKREGSDKVLKACLTMERFSRRRWANGSAQQSNMRICNDVVNVLDNLVINSPFGPIQSSSPTTKELHSQTDFQYLIPPLSLILLLLLLSSFLSLCLLSFIVLYILQYFPLSLEFSLLSAKKEGEFLVSRAGQFSLLAWLWPKTCSNVQALMNYSAIGWTVNTHRLTVMRVMTK